MIFQKRKRLILETMRLLDIKKCYIYSFSLIMIEIFVGDPINIDEEAFPLNQTSFLHIRPLLQLFPKTFYNNNK